MLTAVQQLNYVIVLCDDLPRMKAFYYDPSKYDTYLDQLGIKYPTVR